MLFLKLHFRIVLVLMLGMQLVGHAQNLVVNPSFEAYIDCPVKLGNLEKDVVDWKMPTLGSTDYFNGCSVAMGTPKNFNGQQPADFGVGYVGFYMYAPEDYREYIQGALSTTLKKGERYNVSFYVSLAERSDFAVKQFGIRFSEFPVTVKTTKVLSNMHFSRLAGDTSNQLEIIYANYYSDEIEWVKLTQEFVANGTENYIIIGNFKNNKRTQRYQTKRNVTKGSYYYLDMVSVHKKGTESIEITDYELDSVHVFKNVHFNFNKSTFRNSELKDLESIQQYLVQHPTVKIMVIGHTDTIGNDAFNQRLSLKRAKEVGRYLISKGIESTRITYEGHGSSKPISSNTTKAGRLLNRRVEFVLNN